MGEENVLEAAKCIMCELKDFDHLRLDETHRAMLESELAIWHRCYLPIGKVVLDLGAGNGETAQFYLNHGAQHVICIEPDARILSENFGRDKRITIIPLAVSSVKSDVEGFEENMVIETHFPTYFDWVHGFDRANSRVNIWKLRKMARLDSVMNVFIMRFSRLHYLRIQIAHFVRQLLNMI